MNTESSYIYSGSQEDEGLGRIPPLTLNRNIPTIHKPTVRSRKVIQPKRITLPKPTVKPRPLPKLRPVIDKNPVPPPTKLQPVSKKPAGKQPASVSGGILDGTFNLGGIQIEKKHAAVAGGATAGGLLLWKLLF